MKNPILERIFGPSSRTTVRQLLTVRAGSEKTRGIDVRGFLSKVGFDQLKDLVGGDVSGRMPGGDTTFLLGYDKNGGQNPSFRLIRVTPNSHTEIELGQITRIQPIGEDVEITASGQAMKKWVFMCTPVDFDTLPNNGEIATYTAFSLTPPPQEEVVEEDVEVERPPRPPKRFIFRRKPADEARPGYTLSPPEGPARTPLSPPPPTPEKKVAATERSVKVTVRKAYKPRTPKQPKEKVPEKKDEKPGSPITLLRADAYQIVGVDELVPFQPNTDDPRFTGQPRKWFCPKKLKRLSDGMKEHGQQLPLVVRPADPAVTAANPQHKWEIIAGERRWRAAKMAGISHLSVIVRHPASRRAQHMIALIENLNRADHTNRELSDALTAQLQAGETIGGLADAIGQSRTTAVKLLSLQQLHPTLRALLDPPTPKADQISLTEGSILARISPPEKQLEIWEQAKTQPTRGLIVRMLKELGSAHFQYKRKPRTGHHEGVRSIRRRFNNLNLVLLELKAFTPDEMKRFVVSEGSEITTLLQQLTETHTVIDALKSKITRARAAQKTTPATA
ncbi:MAG: ParB/RepB/Spo0J family partition protein [Candidatus Taylorbacteria bacterium]|nr:ParB/RepB/Spo0J family partition protein [Candidatus Taylorbacteria bacterium]